GVFVAQRATDNLYHKRPDSLYYEYSGIMLDGWAGYNIAGQTLMNSNVRDRKFVALRYAQNRFDKLPYQVDGKFNMAFNNMQLMLGSITFFRHDYYKTNYILGFGTTEDIPYGYKASLTTGWVKQYFLERLYGGLRIDKYQLTYRGAYYRYFLRAGGYFDNSKIRDAGLL